MEDAGGGTVVAPGGDTGGSAGSSSGRQRPPTQGAQGTGPRGRKRKTGKKKINLMEEKTRKMPETAGNT